MVSDKWLSIIEYASYKKKSISTVRRYIKANRVNFKEEEGKYYILVKNYYDNVFTPSEQKELVKLRFENDRLKDEIKSLKEQMLEMNMLVEAYESMQVSQG